MKCIGLIGLGAWGKNILRDLLALQVKVFVVVRSDQAKNEAIEQGASGAYFDLNDIADKVDGFIVATPTSTHADIIDSLLDYHKPIFVEKPLTSEIDRAYQLLRRGKDQIFIMDKWRYHPGIDKIAENVRNGVLGDVLLIKTFRLGWGNPHSDVDAFWILLPHDLSIVLHILGYLPPIYSVVPLVSSDPRLGAIITLKDNVSPTVIIEVSTMRPNKQRGVYVVGREATIELAESYDAELTFFEGKPAALTCPVQKIAIENTMPLYLELKAFVEYLHNGKRPNSSLQEGVRVVEMIDAIRKTLGLSMVEVA